jgi:hypothetical protein
MDDVLTLQARLRNPKVKHWWGRRAWNESPEPADMNTTASPAEVATWHVVRTGAWCYLCRKPITTWSSRYPITEQARAQIDLHRREHVRAALDSGQQLTKETP